MYRLTTVFRLASVRPPHRVCRVSPEIFKDYYKKYGDNDKPSVTVKKIKDTKSEVTNGNDVGEIQYIVKLYSVPTQEMKSIPAVEVVISDKLGKPYLITFDADKKYYTRWNTPKAFE